MYGKQKFAVSVYPQTLSVHYVPVRNYFFRRAGRLCSPKYSEWCNVLNVIWALFSSLSWGICLVCYRGRTWDWFHRCCFMSRQQLKDVALCAVGGRFLLELSLGDKKSWTLLYKPEVFERLSAWLGRIGDSLGRFSCLYGRALVSTQYYVLTLLLSQLSTSWHLSTSLSSEKRSINSWYHRNDSPGSIKLLCLCFGFCFNKTQLSQAVQTILKCQFLLCLVCVVFCSLSGAWDLFISPIVALDFYFQM